MKPIRKWIRDIFGFSGNEINGFIILLPLLLFVLLSQPVYRAVMSSDGDHVSRDAIILDSLLAKWVVPDNPARPAFGENFALFPFDPNTAERGQLRRLGFTESSAKHIAAYRQKGGVFRVKSDLLRIYGLDSSLYNQLYSYIQLPTRLPQAQGAPGTYGGRKTSSWEKKEVKQKFDINTADTLQLKSVYGIGSRLAARIIKFRDGLGGFVKTDQLFEVYGLDSMTVRRLLNVCFIKADFIPEKININNADEQELSAHPYIRYRMARLLVSYRFQHGNFMEAADIKKISPVEPHEVDRLLPYVKTND